MAVEQALPSRARLRRLARLAAIGAAAYAALLATLWFGQEWLIFRPSTLAANHRFAVPADVHEAWVEVDGARLNALHLKLPDPDGVVFYLHGNGGSLRQWWVNPKFWREQNLDLFMIDYRGYGKSSGRIASQQQLEADVRAVWAKLAAQYAGKRHVFFGRSLGTGLAAALAAEVQPDLTILVSAYSSMVQLAREHYPWVPTAMLRYPLRSDEALARVKTPVLLLHGSEDPVIPPSHGRALQAAAPHAVLALIEGAEHGDMHHHDAYFEHLAAALARLRPR
jgi:hypothetical protein